MAQARKTIIDSVVNDGGMVIPGTVHLVDVTGNVDKDRAKGSKQNIVLIPPPSSDPNDPLNWTPRRKLQATLCLCIYTLVVGIASAAIYSVLVPISLATHLTVGDLNAGTGYMFLFFGWGCLIWQPLALQYGKRPVFLISLLGTMATQVWAPYTKTNGQWIASKILQGFFGAPIESLVEIALTDVYFTHERGKYIALYGFVLVGSSFFASVIAGFIAEKQSWQWVLYWCAIFCGAGFLTCYFFLEESNYSRTTVHAVAPGSVQSEISSTAGYLKSENGDSELQHTAEEQRKLNVNSTVRSYWSRMALFQPGTFSKPNHMLGMMKRPFIFLTFPAVTFSGFNYGSNLVWFNVLNGTSSLILYYPPYNFSATAIGLAYLSPFVGGALTFLYNGTFGDWLLIRLARNNHGIMESEHRLWISCASVLVLPFGLILWGVGAAHSLHWFGLIFAMGTVAFSITIGLQVSVSYCIDSYRELSGEAIITVILIRNTMSFAVGYGITPWVTNMGLQNAFILAAVVGMAQACTFLIFIKWGKKFRKMSAQRYRTYVKEMESAGLGHVA